MRGELISALRVPNESVARDRNSHRLCIMVSTAAATVARPKLREWLRFFATKTEKEFKRIKDVSLVNCQSMERDATFNSRMGRAPKAGNSN